MFIEPMELIIDDDDGGLWRVPYSISDDEVEFGERELVKVEYVTAAAGKAYVFASKFEPTKKEGNMADEDSVATAEVEDEAAATGADESTDEEEKPTPIAAGVADVPEGMVLVDEATLGELKAGAKDGREARAEQVKTERDVILDNAIKAGKFPPSRRDHYAQGLEADSVGFTEMINKMAAGLIPVGAEKGAVAAGEGGSVAAYPTGIFAKAAANRRAFDKEMEAANNGSAQE